MKTHRWADIRKRSKLTAAQREENTRWAQREALELSLREVRELAGKTQTELAKEAEIAQGELSRIERREDHLLSTLRKYVEALGGDPEVVAVFNDKRVRLRGV
jgi:DNA-binding XRE family transcriptional regulator